MSEIPEDVVLRLEEFCQSRALEIEALRGSGVDGFVWQTTQDSILKVFRNRPAFQQELAVYQRLTSHQIERLHGFQVPILLHYDSNSWVLELSYVSPPYILDFAAATLGRPPSWIDSENEEWIAEKQRVYEKDWPVVSRSLDSLRHLGIHYTDVHLGNIRVSR